MPSTSAQIQQLIADLKEAKASDRAEILEKLEAAAADLPSDENPKGAAGIAPSGPAAPAVGS
ncbi:hypothetical protein [Methylobacterium sp. Gmos1]